MSTRLQRMLQRQQEREKALKEKEDKRLEKEREKKLERDKEMRAQNAELYENEKEFKEKDNLFGGYVGGLPSFKFALNKHVSKVPEQYETEEKSPFEGNQWKRTRVGWMRIESKDIGYKQPCTTDCLPMWLYEELDIIFGMRRLSSLDFYYSCVILDRLFHQYMWKEDTSTLVKKRILLDVKLAISRLKKNPECAKREERVLFQTVATMANLEQQIKLHFSKIVGTDSDDSEKDVSSILESNTIDNDQGLPEEVLIQIFSNLYKPKDLCSAASVCVYWGALANDSMLFSHFINALCVSLSIAPPDSPLPKKELFIQLWTNKIGPPSTGIAKCTLCGEFFWIFKKSLCRNYLESNAGGTHSGKCFDVTKIIPLLIDRVHHY